MLPEIVTAIRAETNRRKIPLAAGLAVVEVESAGQLFADVDGEREPTMRWEGHYFDRRVKPTLRERARKLMLASAKVGGIKNPTSQSSRYKTLLRPAVALDRQPAFASASYGGPQVMGANAQDLGYVNPEALYRRMKKDAAGQIEVMFKFIDHNGIVDELQRGDYAGFARVYNGPKFRANKYDAKLAAAAKKFATKYKDNAVAILNTGAPTSKPVEAEQASTMLRVGVQGAKVREAQVLLNRGANKFGYAVVKVDSDFGTATYDAVIALQKAQGWRGKNVDGRIGPKTWAVLDQFKTDATEQPGALGPLETDEAKSGGATAIGGTAITAGVEQAKDALAPVVGSGGIIDTIYTILTVIGVVIVLAGIAYMAWGWFKSRKTHGIEGQTA